MHPWHRAEGAWPGDRGSAGRKAGTPKTTGARGILKGVPGGTAWYRETGPRKCGRGKEGTAVSGYGEGMVDRFPEGIELTGYREGDEEEILDLFKKAFGQELSLETWRWKYASLAGARENIFLLRDREGKLCGHYAALPFTLVYEGKELPAALRVDFMIPPDLQRKGLGGLLIEACRKKLAEWCALHVAFPSPSSTPVTRKKQPHILDEAPIYWRLTDARAALRAAGWGSPPTLAAAAANIVLRNLYRLLSFPWFSRKISCQVREGFAGSIPGDAEFRRPGCGIYFRRDARFLHWRFDQNPQREYAIVLLESRGRDTGPGGYAVLATMEYQGFRLGFIVDILVDPPGILAARRLLNEALERLEAQGVEAVTCMMTGRNAYTRALMSLGFVKVPNRFLPRALNVTVHVYNPGLDRDHACNLDNWILTWADTDLV